MATYIWQGTIDQDITNASNWLGGLVPTGSPDTVVIIGHNWSYPDHRIARWPNGGHLDMEIGELTVSPSWAEQDSIPADDTIQIGSPTNYLKASKVHKCTYGSDPNYSPWAPMDNTSTYLHIEQWTAGPDLEFTITGGTYDNEVGNPTAILNMLGNPTEVTITFSTSLRLNWDSTETNIAGTSATKAQNGPLQLRSDSWVPGIGMGMTNAVLTLDWQSATNGGNPVKNMELDGRFCSYTVAADDWEDGADSCIKVWSTFETSDNDPEWYGNSVHITSSSPIGTESAPIDIPSFHLKGYSAASGAATNDNINTCTFQTGVNIGGPAALRGFDVELFDITFSTEAATPTTLKSGNIMHRTRIDASELSVGNFIVMDKSTGRGVKLTPGKNKDDPNDIPFGYIKIKPPSTSNVRVGYVDNT